MGSARHSSARDRRKQLTHRQPRYSKEEFAQRGTEIYDRDIRPNLPPGSEGKISAIDIETGAYEIGEDTIQASDRLLDRCPDAQIWFVRIGRPAVHRIGWHAGSTNS
jgi:hypothetical protein